MMQPSSCWQTPLSKLTSSSTSNMSKPPDITLPQMAITSAPSGYSHPCHPAIISMWRILQNQETLPATRLETPPTLLCTWNPLDCPLTQAPTALPTGLRTLLFRPAATPRLILEKRAKVTHSAGHHLDATRARGHMTFQRHASPAAAPETLSAPQMTGFTAPIATPAV